MDKDASMTLRLPGRLRVALERAAEKERRTLSSLMVMALEDWLAARGESKAVAVKRKAKKG